MRPVVVVQWIHHGRIKAQVRSVDRRRTSGRRRPTETGHTDIIENARPTVTVPRGGEGGVVAKKPHPPTPLPKRGEKEKRKLTMR